MPYKTKEAAQKAKSEWHKKHKHEIDCKRKQRLKDRAEWFAAYKSNCKCEKCGESHPACIEFHHTRDKSDKVSYMVCHALSEETAQGNVTDTPIHLKVHFSSKNSLPPSRI